MNDQELRQKLRANRAEMLRLAGETRIMVAQFRAMRLAAKVERRRKPEPPARPVAPVAKVAPVPVSIPPAPKPKKRSWLSRILFFWR